MKKQIEDGLNWLLELSKKYGWIILVLFVSWIGIKKIWFWLIMPILFLSFLILLSDFGIIPLLPDIKLNHLIMGWIFIFAFVFGIGNLLFEKK